MNSALRAVGSTGLLLVLGVCGSTLQTVDEPLDLGEQAPSFVLSDFERRPVSLESLTEDGPAVIIFYRGHW